MPTWKTAMAKQIEFLHDIYKEPFISMCFQCGKSNATKVKIDKQIVFHAMEKQSSCEQCVKNYLAAKYKNAYWVKSYIYVNILREKN